MERGTHPQSVVRDKQHSLRKPRHMPYRLCFTLYSTVHSNDSTATVPKSILASLCRQQQFAYHAAEGCCTSPSCAYPQKRDSQGGCPYSRNSRSKNWKRVQCSSRNLKISRCQPLLCAYLLERIEFYCSAYVVVLYCSICPQSAAYQKQRFPAVL